MSVKLVYKLDTADNVHYQLYIKEDYLEKLDIPDNIKDELSSVSVTIDETIISSYNFTQSADLIGDLMCGAIQDTLEKCWDFGYGIPVIEFEGYTNKLSDRFKNRSILIYFARNNTDNYIWDREVSFITKFLFLAYREENNSYGLWSTDITYVHSFLQKRIVSVSRNTNPKMSAAYKMKVWYPDEDEREALMSWAKVTLEKFVVEKNYNIYIPEFAVINSFHIRRFKTITDMFKSKYDIDLVMNIPMLYNGTYYSVMFPVCGSLKNNVRGH